MNRFLHGVARAVVETFALPEPILEVGSFQVAGQEVLANLREFFPGRAYLGIDVRPGPGVDEVADVEELPLADESIGTVIAMNTFEHVPHFWRGFDEVYRVLRPDGALLVSCPFYFHMHSFPSDFWRFTPEALEVMLEDYPSKLLGWHGAKKRPANVWALAFREAHAPITPEQFAQYQRRLGGYGRQPLARFKWWRYQLGRWLCGRRPLAPYLDQQCWESVCRNTRYHLSRKNRSQLSAQRAPSRPARSRAQRDGTHAAVTPGDGSFSIKPR